MSREKHLPLERVRRVVRASVIPAEVYEVDGRPIDLTDSGSVAIIERPEEFTWRSWAVFLLHTGAEVEHALLVQYLYGAYSIRPDGHGSTNRNKWRRSVIDIATEEMGHLLTVQNILQSLRAPLNFQREDFPFRTKLYPFPFRLERMTRLSLAKYVLAEMPPEGVPDNVLPAEELEQITQLATVNVGADEINHVGLLYDTIQHALEQLPADAFYADASNGSRLQSGAGDWQFRTDENPSNLSGIKTILVQDKASALQAINVIAKQGEGASGAQLEQSHFKRFLNLFREFPPENYGESPTHAVPTNPNTDFPPNETSITHQTARRWASLFNLRYALLLSALQHALSSAAVTDREVLLGWVFEEMNDSAGALPQLFAKLVTLPLDNLSGRIAAGPFELPPTMSPSHQLQDWWRHHLDILDASRELIERMSAAGTDPILEDVLNRDGRNLTDGRRKQIADHLSTH
jgi:hypothetical protein